MSVLDTLEICFAANLGGVDGQLKGLANQLTGLSSAALQSSRSMQSAGASLAAALGRGLSAGIGSACAQASSAGYRAAQAVGAARGAMSAQGVGLSRAAASGIRSGAGTMAAAARSAALSARFTGGESRARSAGRALSLGFASGIRSGSTAVNAAVNSIVRAATRKIRSMLSIHSPSKVTEGFGMFFGEGFARGIGASAQRVSRSAEALGRSASEGLSAWSLPASDLMPPAGGMNSRVQSAVDRALDGIQLTIPLEVDGVKLGEASIRGINAVTRSAGRVLLNI